MPVPSGSLRPATLVLDLVTGKEGIAAFAAGFSLMTLAFGSALTGLFSLGSLGAFGKGAALFTAANFGTIAAFFSAFALVGAAGFEDPAAQHVFSQTSLLSFLNSRFELFSMSLTVLGSCSELDFRVDSRTAHEDGGSL